PEKAGRVSKELAGQGIESIAMTADGAKEDQIQLVADHTLDEFGRIDVMVNCAGGSLIQSVTDMTLDEGYRQLNSNLTSFFLATPAVLPTMIEQQSGSIVGISSLAAWRAPYRTHYAAAKAGIVGYVRSAAVEIARQGVRINAVAPGMIATERVLSH